MNIVTDSTCLIALARIGKLGILKALFGKIHIPEAVHREVAERGKGKAGGFEVEQADWIIRHRVQDRLAVKLLGKDLGPGEAEAIVLAQELKAHYIILDDKAGRSSAELIGLSAIGTLAILLLAEKKGIISDQKSVVDQLKESGFRVSDELYQKVFESKPAC